jgi:hypothetical protein
LFVENALLVLVIVIVIYTKKRLEERKSKEKKHNHRRGGSPVTGCLLKIFKEGLKEGSLEEINFRGSSKKRI